MEIIGYALCNCEYNKIRKTNLYNKFLYLNGKKNYDDIDNLLSYLDNCIKHNNCSLCDISYTYRMLIKLCLPYQLNFNTNFIKKKNYIKPKYELNNLVKTYLYNINSSIYNYLNFPIFLFNAMINLFGYDFYKCCIKHDFKTYDNKNKRIVLYLTNLIGINFNINIKENLQKKFKLYSFQYADRFNKQLLNYDVINTIYYKSDYIYYAFKVKNKNYLYRLSINKIFILNGVLPFKDITGLWFYQEKKIRKLFKNDSFLIELKMEIIEAENINFTRNKCEEYLTPQHYKLLVDENISRNLNEYYDIKNEYIELFDKSLLSKAELDELINDNKYIEEKNKDNYLIEKNINFEEDEDEEDEEEDNEEEDNEEEDKEDDKEDDVKKEDENIFYYEFSFNKHIIFSNDDIYIIKNSIINKLKNNKKMRELFTPYNTINVIKNYNTSYKKEKYFNIVLFNTETKILSNQYHIYLNNDNEIINITEINSLI